jgi:hypothetical protein
MTNKKPTFSRSFTVALIVVVYSSSYGQSTSSSSSTSIPSATNDVKAGDWINWDVERNILTEVPSTGSHTTPTQTPTSADVAAAASALQTAAKAAITPDAIAAYAPNSTQADKDKLKAAVDAAKQANDEAQKAGAANSNPTIGATTVVAAQDLITTANANVATALRDEATASAKNADEKRAATAKALAYLDAANSAYKKVVADAASGSLATVCAPPGSRFLVTYISPGDPSSNSMAGSSKAVNSSSGAASSINASSKSGASGATGTSSTAPTVQGYYPSKFLFFHFKAIPQYAPLRGRNSGSLTPPATAVSPCGTGTRLPSYDALYQFQATDTNVGAYYREGFTWGGMVIPYKFYLKDKTFKGNPSTVAFVGYEGWFPGMSLAGVVALGPGVAQSASTASTISSPSSKSSSTSTAVTYTAATGLVVTFGGSIKAGLLVGWDWQGSGNNFQYEGKTWVALSIGASF